MAPPTRTSTKALEAAFDPERPAVRKAIDALEVAMGGRAGLIDALSTSEDPDVEYLLGLIADPRADDLSLGVLCDRGNITPGQLLRLYRTARIAKAQVLALDKVADATPAVAEDVMRRAQNHYRICPSCAGTREGWEAIRDAAGKPTGDSQKVPCKPCDGTGQILSDASLDHQRMALELAGLLVKGGGTQIALGVQVSTPAAAPGGPLPFASLQLAVQKILQPDAAPEPPVDATLVDDPVQP
jgi:hypothetical protein